MFFEILASSHIQIPCHEFTGGIPKKDNQNSNNSENKNENDNDDENSSETLHGNLVHEVMTHLLAEYCNKIIPPYHGLCITVSQIDKIGDAKIFVEDGGTYVDVDFRLIIFKPYNNEVIEGAIAFSDASGIRISLGFFEQVFIPKHNLPKPSRFDHKTKSWIYETKNDELVFETDDIVYLKVVRSTFKPTQDANDYNKQKNHSISTRSTPFPSKIQSFQPNMHRIEEKENDHDNDDQDSDMEDNTNGNKMELLEHQLLKQPMIVYGTMSGQGLGPSYWWE